MGRGALPYKPIALATTACSWVVARYHINQGSRHQALAAPSTRGNKHSRQQGCVTHHKRSRSTLIRLRAVRHQAFATSTTSITSTALSAAITPLRLLLLVSSFACIARHAHTLFPAAAIGACGFGPTGSMGIAMMALKRHEGREGFGPQAPNPWFTISPFAVCLLDPWGRVGGLITTDSPSARNGQGLSLGRDQ